MKNTLLCFALCIQFSLATQLCHAQSMPIAYGWVSQSQLSDFAPERLQKTCDLLQQRQLAAAAIGFDRELSKNPDSLVAYVGLVQSKPTVWPAMRSRLEADAAAHKDGTDADTEFKLGTLLFYEWGQLPPAPSMALLIRSQTLLTQAWEQRPLPIEGMMLIDTLHIGKVSTYPPLRRLDALTIEDQLIAALGGNKTYTTLRASEKEELAETASSCLVSAFLEHQTIDCCGPLPEKFQQLSRGLWQNHQWQDRVCGSALHIFGCCTAEIHGQLAVVSVPSLPKANRLTSTEATL